MLKMLLIFFKIIIAIINISDARAQNSHGFGYFDASIETKSNHTNTSFTPKNSEFALEKPVNPKSYIVGPGDVLGINVKTIEKMFFSAIVGPAGDLLIPGVGSVQISGLSLDSSIIYIKDRILRTFKNAVIDVSLVGLKSFKVSLFGAVNEPGFITVQAFTRLDEALSLAGGLHVDADENNLLIKSKDSDSNFVDIKDYLLNGNIDQNPILNQGDRIQAFFNSSDKLGQTISLTLKRIPIFVSGFVNTPGPFKYFPGYNVGDYIGFAGGISEIGSSNKIFLIRKNKKIKTNDLEIVLPGDQIFIPEGTFSVIFGKNSFLQNLTALFSIISTYTIISDRVVSN